MRELILQIIFFCSLAYIILWANRHFREKGTTTIMYAEDRKHARTITIKYRSKRYLVCSVSVHRNMDEALKEAERVLPTPTHISGR